MRRIVEKNGQFGTYYEIYNNEDVKPGKIVSVFHDRQLYNDFEYILLFDSYGRLVEPVYEYLNVELKSSPQNTRIQAISALKVLYSFFELFNFSDKQAFDKDFAAMFAEFLEGGYRPGNEITLELSTKRSNKTFNTYFSFYRQFYKNILKVDDSALRDASKQYRAAGTGFLGHKRTEKHQKYDVNKRVKKATVTPKYISFEDYLNILDLIDKNPKYGIRERLIVTLMYEYGMRIGEVLGLTIEDIEEYETEDKNKNAGRLILRNRITDELHQNAKGVKTPETRFDYDTDWYKEEDVGYECIYVTKLTMDMINKYKAETRGFDALKTEKRIKNLEEKNNADKVSDREDIRHNNYLIISKNYTPISSNGWNRIIKEILVGVGIKLDKVKRKDNLNHRFRHGAAMYKIYIQGYNEVEVAAFLRHSDTATVQVYFNPTPADKIAQVYKTEEYLKRAGVVK